jgi:pimeloyl-ACP methyl ester carboxylesterase
MNIPVLLLILTIMFGILVLLFIISLANHYYHLGSESKVYPPPGVMVDIGSGKLHVFIQGQGDVPLVLLAGHGTSCPTIDFKLLWKRLIGEHRIAVVERAGYGWSEPSSSPRDIETILQETRRALELAGVKGPYILVPHSMAGLEALYWAQRYPDEVKAIIALDPLIPDFVEQYLALPGKAALLFMQLVSRAGLTRVMPETEMKKRFPPIGSRELSAEDKMQFCALFHKRAFTSNMRKEIDVLKSNAARVKSTHTPIRAPIYFFISEGTDVPGMHWRESLVNFSNQCTAGRYTLLDCGHYVHHWKPDVISREMKAFISEIMYPHSR